MCQFIYLSCLALMVAGCTSSSRYHDHELLHCFYPVTPGKNDTLAWYAEQEEWDSSRVKPLSDTLLQRYLSRDLFDQLNFTGEGRYFAAQRFMIDGQTTVCVVYTMDVWFKMTSLLFFNHQNGRVDSVLPHIAQYYGGESGQIYHYSWLYTNKKSPQLFTKIIDHWWLMPTNEGEEITEKNTEQNELRQWNGVQFDSITLADSVRIAAYFRKQLGDKMPVYFESESQ